MATKEGEVEVIRDGLTFSRYFTTDGKHPFDDVEWELRDAVIPNYKEGGNAFEQRDVEFPASWSQNATNIVAQKYFRGTLGTPQRESSVRQLAGRVVDTITRWGQNNGYFASDRDAQVFGEELTHLIVTQKAAFNSPVWFNVGVPDTPQQCSACFILAVDDHMSSILNWYVEEGTIFKGGSGSGINLSTDPLLEGVARRRRHGQRAGELHARSRCERRHDQVGWEDASRSEDGDPQRRSSRRRGLHLVQGQRGAEGAGPARRGVRHGPRRQGQRLDPVPEREQLRSRHRRVHAGLRAGPGLEAQGRHVRRHRRARCGPATSCARSPTRPGSARTPACSTTPRSTSGTPARRRAASTARTRASEYMHLDNSACNLASLNLMKFLNDDGSFDVASFRHAVEVVFTAQEIVVGESDYPTEKIGENARAYRQLGLGYANLGALLMARGLPYDSDAGRAWAGAITAIMTGHAYRTSARIAEVMGPFDGYAPERRRDAARHAQAPRGGGRDRRRARPRGGAVGREAVLGRGDLARRAARLPQRSGIGARADRHDRPDDGLRHDRHRARARARQDQEAGRRRHDAVRQPDGSAGAREARLRAPRRSRTS